MQSLRIKVIHELEVETPPSVASSAVDHRHLLISPRRNARCFLTGWAEGPGRSEQIFCAIDQYFTPA